MLQKILCVFLCVRGSGGWVCLMCFVCLSDPRVTKMMRSRYCNKVWLCKYIVIDTLWCQVKQIQFCACVQKLLQQKCLAICKKHTKEGRSAKNTRYCKHFATIQVMMCFRGNSNSGKRWADIHHNTGEVLTNEPFRLMVECIGVLCGLTIMTATQFNGGFKCHLWTLVVLVIFGKEKCILKW